MHSNNYTCDRNPTAVIRELIGSICSALQFFIPQQTKNLSRWIFGLWGERSDTMTFSDAHKLQLHRSVHEQPRWYLYITNNRVAVANCWKNLHEN